jgi:hypothetical protein
LPLKTSGRAPECEDLDGETILLGDEFADGVSAPPLHPNCRCTVVSAAVAEQEAASFVTKGPLTRSHIEDAFHELCALHQERPRQDGCRNHFNRGLDLLHGELNLCQALRWQLYDLRHTFIRD